MSTRELTFVDAIREAITEEMRKDASVFLMGEDVGLADGVFKASAGLYNEFGPLRVIDTPISEEGFTGLGVGAALASTRPIVELLFGDFSALAMDAIVNQAAKIRYMTGGQARVPLTIRLTMGAGRSLAAQHSQSLQAWFAHIPGLKVVMPATPYDAKGLLKSAIRDDNPVLFFEDKLMYASVKGPVPEEEYYLPFGQADVKRSGSHVTVVATARMVHVALEAAAELSHDGIELEVIDPRTVSPLDCDTIIDSVRKTKHLVAIDQGYRHCGVAAEVVASVAEGAFDYLDAPPIRLSAPDVPVPFAPTLEGAITPTKQQLIAVIRESL
jgi:pyruvate dehydrogenase E1 component beta subunit